MFDTQTPSNLPVEDIFEKTEKPAAPPAPGSAPVASPPRPVTPPPQPTAPRQPAPVMQPPAAPPAPVQMQTPGQGWKKFIWAVVILLILAAAGVAAQLFIFGKKTPVQPVVQTQTPPVEVPEVVAPETTVAPTTTPPAVDSDNDGLTDEEEIGLGTDPRNPDTDGDGLFDGEEVKVYRTNPLDKDTDKDGYLDGEEVINGYNPLGPGKLFVVPPTTTTP